MEKRIKESAFQKIIDLFYGDKRVKVYFLVFFSVIVGLFEFFGLILIYQFILFLMGANTHYCALITDFFAQYFNVKNAASISLFLGVSVALIYIFKNVFLLFYTKYYNKILVDLSSRITFETVNQFLYCDYLETKEMNDAKKLNLVGKINITVWQYCLRAINLYSNAIVAVIILSYLFIKFTLVAFLAFFVITFLAGIEYLYMKKKSSYQNANYSSATLNFDALIFKIVTLIKEIKISSLEKFFIKDLKEKYNTLSKLNENRSFDNVLYVYLTEILIMILFIIVLCTLFYITNFDNKIILSSLCTICVVILRLVPLINRMQSCLYIINSNRKIANEVLDFFEKYPPSQVKECENTIKPLPFENKIVFKNLSFSYDKNSSGLKNINLEIKKGEFIGVAGVSGCYKTTLLNILAGLIFPDEGEIFVDDLKLDKNYIKSWQNKISYITQDHGLMFENVIDNFSIFSKGKPDIKKIEELLCSLGLDNEILKKKESELSCGQKQRVMLINAIYQNKEILLLDEITSSIDVVSQEKISELLNKLKGKKTIISIAHRLRVLSNCDRIIYMDNAKIVDFDTFENLDKKYPKFHEIVMLSGLKDE